MNKSLPLSLLVACLLALGGCSGPQPQAELKPDLARGGRVFDGHCARCHLSPDDEAPQLDEADDWDLRGDLWAQAMKDHGKRGYLEKGTGNGRTALNSQNISDVLYFMEAKVKALP